MEYLLLGLIQGLTEFLPVSSSAHLLIIQKLMDFHIDALQLVVFAHLGTLLALLFYFFKDIKKTLKSKPLVIYILIVTSVTGLIAIMFKKYFEVFFISFGILKFTLIINGIILLFNYFFTKPKRGINSLG